MVDSTYVPGVCNLNQAETRARLIVAWVGIVITVVCLLVFSLVAVPWYFKMLIFIPASLGIVSTLQARFHFCVKYGLQGVFNDGLEPGKTDTVEQAEFRQKDRQKAIQIIVGGALLSAIVTVFALVCL